MKKILFIIVSFSIILCVRQARAQSNNPLSIYEGARIDFVDFDYTNSPLDSLIALDLRTKVEGRFLLFPQTHFNSFMADYYTAQVNLIDGIEIATLNIESSSGNGIVVRLRVTFSQALVDTKPRRRSLFTKIVDFPLLYSSSRTFLTLKFAASQMVYSNNNAWFARPNILTDGNPLATNPTGAGYSAWIEGFAAAGIYGIIKIIPKINLHLYGGANYLVSYSLGPELFTNKSRIYGETEEAFAGIIGGGRTKSGHIYRYNILYGRKQFVLGDGWLIINTSMNGDNRAALQINPRWAAKNLFQAGAMYDRLFVQIFRLQPNELPILNSNTVLQGINIELGTRDKILFGASYIAAPKSDFKYYLPTGKVYTRQGLQLYNLRFYRSSPPITGGWFAKTEVGYQWNRNFKMNAFAFYAEAGWTFATRSNPWSVSYRYAYFSGDNPASSAYNRWDALYTGGTGEQWVQGSNMYKIVQNSNEESHRLQVTINPVRKLQVVGQLWLFYAPELLNLGGNPALSNLRSKFYGAEFNLTLKYFRSRHWYFHLNTAYTLPGGAIRDNVVGVRNWFCLTAFARYSF
ncbi:MAG: alginate export family protein [Mucinivorans sp.]